MLTAKIAHLLKSIRRRIEELQEKGESIGVGGREEQRDEKDRGW